MEPSSPQIKPFDWQRIWLSDNAPPLFLAEVAFRCVFTYLLILALLRITGRRQVKQLSLFELSILLALGSAAGDAMFYDDVPLLHILVVFVVVLLLYLGFNILTERSPRFSDWLEGKSVLLLREGVIDIKALRGQNLTQKELFGEMRQLQIEHLGQVRRLYLEATGEISVFFFPDDEVRPGLPIFPEIVEQSCQRVEQAGRYACATCGYTLELKPGAAQCCPACRAERWLPVCTARRVA